MQTETIIATLLEAAAWLKRPVADLATQSIKDAYEAVKPHLKKKFGEPSAAADALDLATEKPESLVRKALLAEEGAASGLENDRALHELATLLQIPASAAGQNLEINGHGNRVRVAGRDLVTTAKHITQNTITPGARHITGEQRVQL